MMFKLWLLYCAYCQKYNIYAPSYKEFTDGYRTGNYSYAANI